MRVYSLVPDVDFSNKEKDMAKRNNATTTQAEQPAEQPAQKPKRTRKPVTAGKALDRVDRLMNGQAARIAQAREKICAQTTAAVERVLSELDSEDDRALIRDRYDLPTPNDAPTTADDEAEPVTGTEGFDADAPPLPDWATEDPRTGAPPIEVVRK